MKLSETAREVIFLAEAIRNYWDVELPKRHPDYPFIHNGEDSGPPPSETQRLKDLLDSLSEEDIYKLLIVMYLGRGDFGTDGLAPEYEELKKVFGNPSSAVAQMTQKSPLADYLTDGLAELKKGGIDVDKMAFSPISSKK